MQSLQYKRQIDQEVLQADLSIAVEKYEDAIKGMDPSDFAKDPEGALKAAGIDDLYGLRIEKAPIGRQSEIRKKIDYLRDKTTTSMTAAHDTREKVRAAVYNTSNELRSTGDALTGTLGIRHGSQGGSPATRHRLYGPDRYHRGTHGVVRPDGPRPTLIPRTARQPGGLEAPGSSHDRREETRGRSRGTSAGD